MHLLSLLLLMFIFPAASVIAEAAWRGGFGEMPFIGTWFAFWPMGVRLFVAGLRQVLQPSGIPIQP